MIIELPVAPDLAEEVVIISEEFVIITCGDPFNQLGVDKESSLFGQTVLFLLVAVGAIWVKIEVHFLKGRGIGQK